MTAEDLNNQSPGSGQSIFILNSPAKRINQIEKYLIERGWAVKSSSDIRTALKSVIAERPTYFLICIDHPFKKVRSLPKLLSSALPIQIVPYTEVGGTSAFKALTESGCEKVIFPPFNGSAIERVLVGEGPKKNKKVPIYKAKASAVVDTPSITAGQSDTTNDDFKKAIEILNSLANENSVDNEDPALSKECAIEKPMLSMQLNEKIKPKPHMLNLMKKLEALLAQSADVDQTAIAVKLPEQPKLKCIAIESEEFSGYLVIAADQIDKIPQMLIDGAKNVILDSFQGKQPMSLSGPTTLKLDYENIEFQDWIKQQSDFHNVSVHGGQELAFSFFSTGNPSTGHIVNKEKKFYSLSIASVLADAPIDFDLFIYLPLNSQVKAYIKEGQVLLLAQKERLIATGITNFYYRPEDALKMHQGRARHFLNDSIKGLSK